MTGTKTFSKDITVEKLTTNKKTVSFGGTSYSSESTFDETENPNFILRTDTDATINKGIIMDKKVKIDSVKASNFDTATWDTVNLKKFFTNLISDEAQTLTGDLKLKSATLTGGLSKSSAPTAVSKINSVDIVDISKKALRIDGKDDNAKKDKTTLKDVKFDKVVATAATEGVLLGGTFHGVDLSKDALTRKRTTTLDIDVDHTFSGIIKATKDVELDGHIKNIDGTKTINQDQLWKFLKADSTVKKIEISHTNGGSSTDEPSLTKVNGKTLTTIESSNWNRVKPNTFSNRYWFGEANVNGVLKTKKFDSDLDLDSIKNKYLSKSKAQTITGSFTFSKKLEASKDMTCPKINVLNDQGQEGLIKTYKSDGETEDASYKFKDRQSKVGQTALPLIIG